MQFKWPLIEFVSYHHSLKEQVHNIES